MEASKLNLILEQHKLWLETNGVQGERANLVNANLNGANLSYANLYGADLRRANLGYANLRGANLSSAKFSDADLTHANLIDADFFYANLRCANLSYANLIDANFFCANLQGANLQGANLFDARFADADLTGADLSGADLTGAELHNVDLSGITGLHDISWIIPGCLVQLNKIRRSGFYLEKFYLEKKGKYENFAQDSLGFFIQDNVEENTFDVLVGDRIIRNIPHWVKYTGLKQVATV